MTTPVMIGKDHPVPEGYVVIGEDDEGKYLLPRDIHEQQVADREAALRGEPVE
jgi:hypothetical protein